MRQHVVYRELDSDLLGYYDPVTETLTVDPRLPKRDRHLTLVHEGFHKLGHHGPAPAPVELAREVAVEAMTAMYFISFRALLDAFIQCAGPEDMAAFLHVDKGLIYARFLSLTKLEQVMLQTCGRHCIGVDTREPIVVERNEQN